jgi:hypothetical protein
MSLEWARVRALQEQMRLRRFVKASEHTDWVGVDARVPAHVIVCVAYVPAPRCPSLSSCGVTTLGIRHSHVNSVVETREL